MAMTKKEAIRLMCGQNGTPYQLAVHVFGIQPAAVYNWNDEQIPELRELQIRKMLAEKKAKTAKKSSKK